ncbi:MAG: hypothetical protein ACRCYR_03735 [Phycicoccus sp.]
MPITGLTSSEINVAARSYLFLAPVGTAAPVDAVTDPATPWKCVGLTTPDSLSFQTSPSFKEVPSAQSDYPALRFQDGDAATLAVQLLQWSAKNFQAVYGGGAIVEVTPATTPKTYKYTPPKIGERGEVAALVDIRFGAKAHRFVYPRVFQTEGVQLDLKRGEESRLPLSYAILADDGVAPWYLMTNDSAFAPAV